MICDWQKTVGELTQKTWDSKITWTPTTFKKAAFLKFILRKRVGTLRGYLTTYQGSSWRLYRDFIFTKTSAKTLFRLEIMGWIRRPLPLHPMIKELFEAAEFRSWEIDETMRRELAENGFLIRPYTDKMDYKSRTILYQEGDCRLNVYLELCCAADKVYYWGGTLSEVSKWTYPPNAEISSQKQAQIIDRITRWGETHKIPIKFEKGMTPEEMKTHLRATTEAAGFVIVENSDGGWTANRPAKNSS